MLKEVSVDTLNLVCKFTKEQKEELYNLVDFQKDYGENYKFYWNGNKVYKHIIHSVKPFFMIFFEPRVGTGLWTRSHYDILILLQRDAIVDMPTLLKEVLRIGEWGVKRIDVAFDWSISINEHFMWKNGNVKKETIKENQNYYLYGERNSTRAVLYDKKQQLKSKKKIVIEDRHLTRLEIRVRPKLKDQPSISNYEWLKIHFDKFIFVENASRLSRSLTKDEDKKAFRALRRNSSMDWSKYGGDSVKRRIRNQAKKHAVNLYSLFNDNSNYSL